MIEESVHLTGEVVSERASILNGATSGSGVLAKLGHEIFELSGVEESIGVGVGGLPCGHEFGLSSFLALLTFLSGVVSSEFGLIFTGKSGNPSFSCGN